MILQRKPSADTEVLSLSEQFTSASISIKYQDNVISRGHSVAKVMISNY